MGEMKERFCCAPGGIHYSLFIIRYSLFTEIRISGLLAAGFSIGSSNLSEAAISGVQ